VSYDTPGGHSDDVIEFIEIRSDVTEDDWNTVADVPAGWAGAAGDARLIASAPKLPAALRGALYVLDENRDGFGPSKQMAIAEAHAVIAEATAASPIGAGFGLPPRCRNKENGRLIYHRQKQRSRRVSRVVAYLLNPYVSSGDETWPVQIPCFLVSPSGRMS
jgi:hypothetical protein